MGKAIDYKDVIGHCDRVIERFKFLLEDARAGRKDYGEKFLSRTDSPTHGVSHWVRVGIFGLSIAARFRERGRITTGCLKPDGALEDAVLYAVFFHDCARSHDGVELEHGREGNAVWMKYAAAKKLYGDLKDAVSQALLFHVDHPSVDPSANEAAVCLCNGDRLDRVRLGEYPEPGRMYDDGIWRELNEHAPRLLREISMGRVMADLGL